MTVCPVHLRLVGFVTQEIEAHTTDSVHDVLERIGLPTARIVIDGVIVSPAFSLAFYGLTDNAVLTVVPPVETQKQEMDMEKWSRAPRAFSKETVDKMRAVFEEGYAYRIKDPEEVFERARVSIDPITARECARVKDLFRMRIESNSSVFGKILYRYSLEMKDKPDVTTSVICKTVVPQKAAMPSTDFLP